MSIAVVAFFIFHNLRVSALCGRIRHQLLVLSRGCKRRFLLQHGADLTAVNLDGQTALDMARDSGEDDASDVVHFLETQYKIKGTYLHVFT